MLFRRRRDLFSKRGKNKSDWILIITLALLLFIGVLAISNATADPYAAGEGTGILNLLSRMLTYSTQLQLIWVCVGLAALLVLTFAFDYRIYGEIALIIYIGANLLLAVTLFLPKVAGINAWIKLIGDRTFQPAELCKVAIIVTLAKHLSDRKERITTLRDFLPYFVHFAVPFALVVLQDDYGTAMVFACIFVGMLFVAGMSWQLFVGLGLTAAVACVAVWPFLSDFRQNRVLDFLDPTRAVETSGHQVYYSKIAIGSGQFSGKGMFVEGSISQLDFVPEKHTDFIFAVTAESIGFIGCLLLVLLYLTLLVRLFYVSSKIGDPFGSLIVAGVASMFLFHIFENIGMTIGLMPVTGIPLPFLSYGGSNLLANMCAMGLVFNVIRNQQRGLF